MSRYDYETYTPIAKAFLRKRLSVGLATNTIILILRFGIRINRGARIWVDPPWRLYYHRKLISWPGDYPRPGTVAMRYREKLWFERLKEFRRQSRRLLAIKLRFDDTLSFLLDSGWELRVPAWPQDRDESQWYDNWYAQNKVLLPRRRRVA